MSIHFEEDDGQLPHHCERCEARDEPCPECGCTFVHHNGACGDPECCGPSEDLCVECGEARARW